MPPFVPLLAKTTSLASLTRHWLFQALAFVLIAGFQMQGSVAAQATFIPLPTQTYGIAITGDGHRVTGAATVMGSHGMFLWDHRAGFQFFVPGPQVSAAGRAITKDGDVVAGAFAPPNQSNEPFQWAASGGFVGLGTPPNSGGLAHDISDDGATIVGSQGSGVQLDDAFVWTSSAGRQVIPGMFEAMAVSADGNTVAGSTFLQASMAALWSSTNGLTLLGDIPGGGDLSRSMAMTPDGSVVVGFGLAPSGPMPMRWSAPTGMVGLGNLPGMTGHALGVSSSGERIVGDAWVSTSPTVGFYWSPQTGILPMRDHLISLGAQGLAGVEIVSVAAISDDGNAITGRMQGQNGIAGFIAYFDKPNFSIGAVYCNPAEANSTNNVASILAVGSELVADNDLTLEAFNVPAGEMGMFLVSDLQGFTAFPGGSQGNLCLGGLIGRFNSAGEVFVASTSGQAHLTVDLASIPGPQGLRVVQAGQTWSFQAWYRDVNPLLTSNFTNAVSVTFQ